MFPWYLLSVSHIRNGLSLSLRIGGHADWFEKEPYAPHIISSGMSALTVLRPKSNVNRDTNFLQQPRRSSAGGNNRSPGRARFCLRGTGGDGRSEDGG